MDSITTCCLPYHFNCLHFDEDAKVHYRALLKLKCEKLRKEASAHLQPYEDNDAKYPCLLPYTNDDDDDYLKSKYPENYGLYK